MGTQLFANNSASTLAASVSSIQTALAVANGQGALFPSPTSGDWFLLTLTQTTIETSQEIVKVTARAGDVLTVIRAQEGTTASAWDSGSKAELRLTAGSLVNAQSLGGISNRFTIDGAQGAQVSVGLVLTGKSGSTAGWSYPLASGLNNTSGYVNIANAAAPVAGQVLTALTYQTAAWQTPTSGGDVTVAGAQTLSNKTVESLILNNGYTEEVSALSGASPTISPIYGSIQTWSLTSSATPYSSSWLSGQSVIIMIEDGAGYTINWSNLSVVWKTNGGVAPTLSLTGYTVITLWKVGTVIYGARVGDA